MCTNADRGLWVQFATIDPASFPYRVEVLIHPAWRSRLYPIVRATMSAPSTSPGSPCGVMAAWASAAIQPVPRKHGGVRPRPPARSSALPMLTAGTWPLAQQRFRRAQRNPPAARVGLFGRSECDRADRGARWAAVALKQPPIRELPTAQRGRTLVRTAFKVRFSPKSDTRCGRLARSELGQFRKSAGHRRATTLARQAVLSLLSDRACRIPP
jgi:hypothetical protein